MQPLAMGPTQAGVPCRSLTRALSRPLAIFPVGQTPLLSLGAPHSDKALQHVIPTTACARGMARQCLLKPRPLSTLTATSARWKGGSGGSFLNGSAAFLPQQQGHIQHWTGRSGGSFLDLSAAFLSQQQRHTQGRAHRWQCNTDCLSQKQRHTQGRAAHFWGGNTAVQAGSNSTDRGDNTDGRATQLSSPGSSGTHRGHNTHGSSLECSASACAPLRKPEVSPQKEGHWNLPCPW